MTKQQTHSAAAILCGATLILAACGGREVQEEASESSPAVEVAAPAVTVTPITGNPTFEGATLALTNVKSGDSLESGTVNFEFSVAGFELGAQTEDAAATGLANSGQGQHIHLIVDNGPYSAHYEPAAEVEIADGYHVALAFLSRSYHMSLKQPAAAVLVDFTVGDAGEYEAVDMSAPHLFYSRPKGTYADSDADPLMLDFYLLNTELSPEGNKVRATIDGQEFLLTEWVPYAIRGLGRGEIEISLELIDADGNVVPGPYNSVTRTVTLSPPAAGDGAGG